MSTIIEKIRNSFYFELKTEGDFWRILRKESLVDMIILSFFRYQKDGMEKHLVDIFNHSMKIRLLSRIRTIEIKGDINELIGNFNIEAELILMQYEDILNEVKQNFNGYYTASVYDLNSKIQYVKVVNQFEIDSYDNSIFDDIICITYNIIRQLET